MLMLRQLSAGYGGAHARPVLQGVDLELARGELLLLLGRNGSGRSTLLRALMGLIPAQGHASWCGHGLLGLPTHRIARLGVGYVPESRDVFARLTVAQNLALGQRPQRQGPWSVEELLALFPQLRARWSLPAAVLSGGEQQMLSLCRTLLGQPDLLLLDEPTEGLAPTLVQQVHALVARARGAGLAVLLIHQRLPQPRGAHGLPVDRCAVLGQGRVVFVGTPQHLLESPEVTQRWLMV